MNSIRRCLVSILSRIAAWAARCAQYIELGPRRLAYHAWVSDRGDLTKRLEYELDSSSIVWDVGGYEGQWASDIVARFGCKVHIFEPAPPAIEFLRRRFALNPLIVVWPFAIGAEDGESALTLAGDESSIVINVNSLQISRVPVRDIISVWRELGSFEIKLLKVNIEGGEFELLERLTKSECIKAIQDIQVQFHLFVPGAVNKRRCLEVELARTHERTWCYDFVWENWRRRS